ncbi:MAG: DNA-protecting protein DprA, partial [bacterium]|nr:DNA-protecting protein DprA [bacterium]
MLHTLAFPTSRSGVLFARSGAAGPPPVLPAAAVAVVGSRRADPRALEASRAFAAQAHAGSLEPARSGFCVVSGLALGCDSAAHSGCIAAGGVTVAVLPCGLDRVAPRSNAPLADRILT